MRIIMIVVFLAQFDGAQLGSKMDPKIEKKLGEGGGWYATKHQHS